MNLTRARPQRCGRLLASARHSRRRWRARVVVRTPLSFAREGSEAAGPGAAAGAAVAVGAASDGAGEGTAAGGGGAGAPGGGGPTARGGGGGWRPRRDGAEHGGQEHSRPDA